jgi:flagellar P-ring protein precursor FlgI
MRSRTLLLLTLTAILTGLPAVAGPRIKDLAMIGGARDNQLVGYGLVIGLAGDGDKNPIYTLQTIANMLQRQGINVPAATLSSKNVAAVMVTADIPASKRLGSRIDVNVASLGDAKSLQGGILMQTPLLGANRKMYASAQGAISTGGLSAGTEGGGGASVQKNHPTVGQIIRGAIVEEEIPNDIALDRQIELFLHEPDFTSSARMAATINSKFPSLALPIDAATIRVKIPENMDGTVVDFIARLEELTVNPDVAARIIINERTGTIVATASVRISACAVSHGNVTISIASTLDVSQPAPLSQTGTTQVTPSTKTSLNESKSKLILLPEMPSVEKVAAALNALGVSPRDMMSIFQAMKQAGALHAELIIR